MTVSYATVAGTATSGLDDGAASGTFTIPAGTAAGTTYSADIAVVNDAMTEPTETFTVPGAVASGPHTVSIVNDDTSGYTTQVDLTPATQGVSEAAGVVRLAAVVTTADGRPTPSDVWLTLSAVHEWDGANRASPNVDYQAFGQAGSGAAWFPLAAGTPSGTTASVSVLLGNDGAAEADEWFPFRMAPAAASAVPVQLVWIYDDDRAGARSFSAAGAMTAGGGDATASGGATSGGTAAGAGGTLSGAGAGTGGTTVGAGAGGVITLPKGPTGAPTFPRGATGGWTIERKAPALPPAAPLTWATKGGARSGRGVSTGCSSAKRGR